MGDCGIENVYAIIRATVAGALDTLSEPPPSAPFDIVLLDPPYAPKSRDDLAPILSAAGRLLAPSGVVVLECARRSHAPAGAGRLVRSRDVVSGDSALAFYDVLAP
jgi:16S rRNA G966 N2-methylase RsmD